MAHHPEKFLDGRMLWRGRIYSPLPFVRSLWGDAHQRRRLGHGGVPVGLSHRRPSVRVPAALGQVAGDLVRAARSPALAVAATGEHRWAAALLLGAGVDRHRGDDREERRLRAAVGRRLAAAAAGSGTARWSRTCISSSRSRASAARSAACCRRRRSRCRSATPQTSRGPRPSLARSVARAAADLRQRHRGSLLERDLDVGRARARRSSPTGCAARAPSASIEIDEGWSRRPRRQRARRPLGLARRPRARRGARRRQGAAARQHAPAADELRRRQRARARRGAARRGRHRRGAALAAGRRHRRGAHASAIIAFVVWRTAQTTAIVRRGDRARSRPASAMTRDARRARRGCR